MSREIQTHSAEPATRRRSLTCSPKVSVALTGTIALCLSIAASGCLGGSRSKPEPSNLDHSAEHATRIESLRASIERDHRTLEDLISQPGLAADRSLHENPELRAIAERLTAQEDALEQLKTNSSSQTEKPGPSGPAE